MFNKKLLSCLCWGFLSAGVFLGDAKAAAEERDTLGQVWHALHETLSAEIAPCDNEEDLRFLSNLLLRPFGEEGVELGDTPPSFSLQSFQGNVWTLSPEEESLYPTGHWPSPFRLIDPIPENIQQLIRDSNPLFLQLKWLSSLKETFVDKVWILNIAETWRRFQWYINHAQDPTKLEWGQLFDEMSGWGFWYQKRAFGQGSLSLESLVAQGHFEETVLSWADAYKHRLQSNSEPALPSQEAGTVFFEILKETTLTRQLGSKEWEDLHEVVEKEGQALTVNGKSPQFRGPQNIGLERIVEAGRAMKALNLSHLPWPQVGLERESFWQRRLRPLQFEGLLFLTITESTFLREVNLNMPWLLYCCFQGCPNLNTVDLGAPHLRRLEIRKCPNMTWEGLRTNLATEALVLDMDESPQIEASDRELLHLAPAIDVSFLQTLSFEQKEAIRQVISRQLPPESQNIYELTRLTLPCVSSAVLPFLAPVWPFLHLLQALDLRANNWEGTEIQTLLKALPSMPELKVLKLSGNRIGNQTAGQLAQSLGFLSKLKTLELANTRINAPEELGKLGDSFHVLQTLEKVNLESNAIRGEGAIALLEIWRPTHLYSLALGHNRLGRNRDPERLKTLLSHMAPTLISLDVRDNGFSETALADLSPVFPGIAETQGLYRGLEDERAENREERGTISAGAGGRG